jgi:hypothetical protein
MHDRHRANPPDHRALAMLLDDFRADEWADLFTDNAAWI